MKSVAKGYKTEYAELITKYFIRAIKSTGDCIQNVLCNQTRNHAKQINLNSS